MSAARHTVPQRLLERIILVDWLLLVFISSEKRTTTGPDRSGFSQLPLVVCCLSLERHLTAAIQVQPVNLRIYQPSTVRVLRSAVLFLFCNEVPQRQTENNNTSSSRLLQGVSSSQPVSQLVGYLVLSSLRRVVSISLLSSPRLSFPKEETASAAIDSSQQAERCNVCKSRELRHPPQQLAGLEVNEETSS